MQKLLNSVSINRDTGGRVPMIDPIDEKIISNGTIGPITKEIQTNYENAVLGTDNNSRNWLTYIE